MNSHNRRAARPGVERVEARQLLSALTTGLIGTGDPSPSALVSHAIVAEGSGGAGGGGSGGGGTGSGATYPGGGDVAIARRGHPDRPRTRP